MIFLYFTYLLFDLFIDLFIYLFNHPFLHPLLILNLLIRKILQGLELLFSAIGVTSQTEKYRVKTYLIFRILLSGIFLDNDKLTKMKKKS